MMLPMLLLLFLSDTHRGLGYEDFQHNGRSDPTPFERRIKDSPLQAPLCLPKAPMRSDFFQQGGWGNLVSFPSIGGIILARPSPVDLQHLKLPRTNDSERSSNPDVEDELALRMMQLGATWWPDWTTYSTHTSRMDDENNDIRYSSHFPPRIHVGYPSTGGLWVAKHSADFRDRVGSGYGLQTPVEDVEMLAGEPELWKRRMDMTLTMDEKCEVMKDLGAVFYEKLEDCPDIAKTLEEGRRMFGKYEKPLEQMAYRDYIDQLVYTPPPREEDLGAPKRCDDGWIDVRGRAPKCGLGAMDEMLRQEALQNHGWWPWQWV